MYLQQNARCRCNIEGRLRCLWATIFPGNRSEQAILNAPRLAARLQSLGWFWPGLTFRVKPRFAIAVAVGAPGQRRPRIAVFSGVTFVRVFLEPQHPICSLRLVVATPSHHSKAWQNIRSRHGPTKEESFIRRETVGQANHKVLLRSGGGCPPGFPRALGKD